MRFRPRFSVRTLVILVTLVCAYFGAWEATKKYGVPHQIHPRSPTAASPMPLMYWQDEVTLEGKMIVFARRYYGWLFGLTFKLPFENETARIPA